MRPWRPVRGMVRPFSAGWFLMLSGVSPCAICQTISPLFRSIAVMRPYGGLMSGSPWTVSAAAAAASPPPRPPPARAPRRAAPPPAAAPAGPASRARAPCPGRSPCPTALGSAATRPSALTAAVREDVEHVRLGIERAALPVRAAGRRRQHQRRQRALPLADDRRREDRADLVARRRASRASARSSGVKSIRSSIDTPWRSNGGGLVTNGCVGEYHSPGTSPFSTGRSSIGQTGWPVTRSKT